MDNVPPLDAVTFSVTRYNLWVACRLQSIGDMMKAEMERNRLFREEVRHTLVQLQAEVERLANNSNAGTACNNAYGSNTPNGNGNHSDDPRFDVSARISDMLGSTSASITEALLESDSQPASLLAPYGLIPPTRLPIGCIGQVQPESLNSGVPQATAPPMQIKQEVQMNEIVVGGEEEELLEEDLLSDVENEIKNDADPATAVPINGPQELKVAKKHKQKGAKLTRPIKNNYIDEWKKRRARELASARMRRFRERQKLKKEMISNLSSSY